MTAEIVKFPCNASRPPLFSAATKIGTPEEIDTRPPSRSLSITGKNERFRQERREVWRMAEAAPRYWRLRLDFQFAVSHAQRMGIPEGRDHLADPEDRGRQTMVQRWRAALVKQLLTPAPDVASVKWKQAALARGELCYTDVKPERIERAIADDLAFLAAHPVRQSNRRRQE